MSPSYDQSDLGIRYYLWYDVDGTRKGSLFAILVHNSYGVIYSPSYVYDTTCLYIGINLQGILNVLILPSYDNLLYGYSNYTQNGENCRHFMNL